MALVRMIVAWKDNAAVESRDAMSNTLYFNVSGSIDPPDYTDLANDVWTCYQNTSFAKGRYVDVRAYDMADAEPRAIKGRKMGVTAGTMIQGGPRQVALALSYYADRNLPGMRGRIYTGPYLGNAPFADDGHTQSTVQLGQALADVGGLNVDWSLYSPSRQDATRITNVWCDNSWDVIRSRKLKGTARSSATING